MNCFNKIYDDLHSFVQVKLKAKMLVREALYIRQCIDVLQGILEIEEDQSILLIPCVYNNSTYLYDLQRRGVINN